MHAADQTQLSPERSDKAAGCCCTRRWVWLFAVLALAVVVGTLLLRSGDVPPPKASLNGATPLAADRSRDGESATAHPLHRALEFARRVDTNLRQNVHDYTAVVLKQERYEGVLKPLEICAVKIREQPFSAYMNFLSPPELKGQEALFVKGANDGKLFGHAGSGIPALVGTVQIAPDSFLAMRGQRYPITELGIANLTRRLIEVGEHDQKYGECYVWMDEDAKVGDRSCTSITVMHPVKRKAFIYHIARIFVDNQLLVPVHYEAYDWPSRPGEPPVLLERYTYTNLKLNPGLTDADFDPKNPQYNFGLK